MNGTVKWFMRKHGYGVINGEDGKEYFVHYSEIQTDEGEFKTLYRGEPVSFDPVPGVLREGEKEEKRKDNAANVVVLDPSPVRSRFKDTEKEH